MAPIEIGEHGNGLRILLFNAILKINSFLLIVGDGVVYGFYPCRATLSVSLFNQPLTLDEASSLASLARAYDRWALLLLLLVAEPMTRVRRGSVLSTSALVPSRKRRHGGRTAQLVTAGDGCSAVLRCAGKRSRITKSGGTP